MSITAPFTLYYKNAFSSLTSDYAESAYPVSNLLDRIDGTIWKSTSSLAQRVYSSSPGVTGDYCLIYGHNLSGAQVALEFGIVVDTFSDSSLYAQWKSAVAGSGTVVETTYLTLTSSANADAAMLMENQTYVKSNPRRMRHKIKNVSISNSTIMSGLAYRVTPSSVSGFQNDTITYMNQNADGTIAASYFDTTATAFKYWNPGSQAWQTTPVTMYAGAVNTDYIVELVNDGTSFRYILSNGTGTVLIKTGWVPWTSSRSSGSGALTWFLGDPFNDAWYSTIRVTLGEACPCKWVMDATDNKSILRTFASSSSDFWSISIVPAAPIPFVGGVYLGAASPLDYANSIAPDDEEDKGIVNVSDGGLVQGIHDKYIERQVDVGFNDADSTLWAKIKDWRDSVGLGLFGVQWGDSSLGNEVWMMRRKNGKFDAPLKSGGAYRDCTLSLVGRKE
jgi:hypothetical protein